MEIHVLATGSSGNCYMLEDEGSRLLIEAGVSPAKLNRLLNFQLPSLDGCLISHEHKDHSIGGRAVMKSGVNLYCSEGTAEAMGWSSHRLKIARSGQKFTINNQWRVIPFPLVHDAEEPIGFILDKGEHRVLYVTDTATFDYRINRVTHLMVECNWQPEYIEGCPYRDRLLLNHMSLSQATAAMTRMDLSKLREVVVIHESAVNANHDHIVNVIRSFLQEGEQCEILIR